VKVVDVGLLKRARDLIAVEGTEGRNPFEVLTLSWAVFVGASFTFGTPTPGSFTEDLPTWAVTTWYILLCIGGLVGLVGVWLRNLALSLLVERAAMLIVSPSALLYSMALLSLGGARAVVYGSLTMAFAIASFVRIIRIGHQIKKIHSLLGTVTKEWTP